MSVATAKHRSGATLQLQYQNRKYQTNYNIVVLRRVVAEQ